MTFAHIVITFDRHETLNLFEVVKTSVNFFVTCVKMLNGTGRYAGLKVKNQNKFILVSKISYIFVKLKNDNFFQSDVYENASIKYIT